MQADLEKENAALEAVKLIQDNMIIGLGTGSTANYAIRAIAAKVQQGLRVQAVPTSVQTAALAAELGIPLLKIDAVEAIDLTIDGADEFTGELLLLKGGGGALLKEKIVAVKSRRLVIIADASKLVPRLGKFKLPVAVVPDAAGHVLKELAGKGAVRMQQGAPFITDEGNYIIDADFGLIADPAGLDRQLNNIVGVVEHGLFIGLASRVIMGEGDTVRIFGT